MNVDTTDVDPEGNETIWHGDKASTENMYTDSRKWGHNVYTNSIYSMEI